MRKHHMLVAVSLLHCVTYIVSQTVAKETIVYAELGEEVTLQCMDENASTSIWRRKNAIISDGRDINPTLSQMHRFRIVGEQALGEYFLKIRNIIITDVGSYWCELQNDNDLAKEVRVTIRLKGEDISTTRSESVTRKEKYTTELVENIRTTYIAVESTSVFSEIFTTEATIISDESTVSVIDAESSTEKLKSTLGIVSGDEEDISTKSGFPLDDQFWFYGLLVGGLVVVFVSSILCNICINHKCKTTYLNSSKKDESSEQVEELQDGEYETINEREMIPIHITHSTDELRSILPEIAKSGEMRSILPVEVISGPMRTYSPQVLKSGEKISVPQEVAKSGDIISFIGNSNEIQSTISELIISNIKNPTGGSSSSSERSYLEVLDENNEYLNPYESIKSKEGLPETCKDEHEYCKPSEICVSKAISSPEYERTETASDAEESFRPEEICLAKIIVKQIESTLTDEDTPLNTSSHCESLDNILMCRKEKQKNPYVSLEITTGDTEDKSSSAELEKNKTLDMSSLLNEQNSSVPKNESVPEDEANETSINID